MPSPPKVPSLRGPAPLSEDDEAALAEFCAGVDYADLSFASWKKIDLNLDIELRLKIEAHAAQSGGSSTVKFTRTIHGRDIGNPTQKVRVEIVVNWLPKTVSGSRLHYPGCGDCDGTRVGDVFVILQVVA